MKILSLIGVWLIAIPLFFQLSAQTFDYNQVAPHPRLLMKKGEEQKIKENIQGKPEMLEVYNQIISEANKLLIQPTETFTKVGIRFLTKSLNRILTLSFAYRMTGDEKFQLRAEQEMVALASFESWNPSHFLDAATVTLAMAIGYDWLYDQLQPETKQLVREAILQKGIAPSKVKPNNKFLSAVHNWNQVCNAGMIFGALALLETDREESIEIIERSIKSLPTAMAAYGPDGNYPEGYAYWGYGTSFNVLLIAGLESAFEKDGGLSQTPGFIESARFMQYMIGSSHIPFNYSDCGTKMSGFPAMYWFASKANDPSLLWSEKTFLSQGGSYIKDQYKPLMLIYGSHFSLDQVTPPTEKVWTGRGRVPVVLVRTDWEKDKGCYLAIKGGEAHENHAHMDGGSFVFDALGVRWAGDLGLQDYHSLEKENLNIWDRTQTGDRWRVFRYHNTAHNTLTVNEKDHFVDGMVTFNQVYRKGNKLGGELNMAPLFGGALKKATREVVLINESYLQVTDRIQAANEAASVRWTMVTGATPKQIDKRTLELTQEGKRLKMVLDSPSSASFAILDNNSPHSYDAPNPDSYRI
ncbi:MAG: heparinase II/III family protein, partial [Parabacteroides sp.]|nr:heparinase II/III family protein [Parabacteroides sp.]